ncbi:hypothetical protein EG834_21650, partial [bacterium]|nr:hypothetical protein [bacterium]
MMGSLTGDDGIFWIPKTGGRDPWLGPDEMRLYAHIVGNGRMMYAMMQWYQYTGDIIWKERIDRMVGGFDKILSVHKEDYAYFPTKGWMEECYLGSCFIKGRGWKDTSEPADEKFGEEGSLFNHQGCMAGALANWYLLSGNKQALRLAGELVRFITKPKFWADWKGGEYRGVVGSEHAHWNGHVHGYINTLRAVLEYAIAANDPELKAFVRDGYEWARQPVLARFGLIGDGQGCGCGRLIGLAVKLCYSGVGDYWEDVDMYIRNMGTEMQYVPEDHPDFSASEKTDPVNAMAGAFSSSIFKNSWAMCCSPHGSMGLFYAWDGTLRYSDGTA